MKLKIILTWIGIIIIGMIPILLLLAFGPKDYSSMTHTLGQISGLVGMTFFALTFIFSTRARWIEDLFDGLDKVYPVHAFLGSLSFVLLLLHPLLLVMKYIPENVRLAAKYLLPGGLISVDFGIFALAGMIILLVVTFYSQLRYNQWKFSHEFLGLFFILAVLHVFLVRATVARDYIFSGYYVYVAIVSVIGLGGFAYSLLRTRIKGKRYRIAKIKSMGDTQEITLEPKDAANGISFNSGQFVFVKFYCRGISSESHPFSISSPSGTGSIRITVKNLGDFTCQLGRLSEGNKVIVEGPYGRFHQKKDSKDNTKNLYSDEIWIAGGVGVTPFLGLAEDFKDSKSGHVDLYYTVKSKEEFVHLKELQDIAKYNAAFRVFPWASNEQGYLTLDEIT